MLPTGNTITLDISPGGEKTSHDVCHVSTAYRSEDLISLPEFRVVPPPTTKNGEELKGTSVLASDADHDSVILQRLLTLHSHAEEENYEGCTRCEGCTSHDAVYRAAHRELRGSDTFATAVHHQFVQFVDHDTVIP